MLVQRSNPVTPLTPVSTPPGTHNSDLSPRSSNSSFASSDGLHTASLHSPNNDRSPQEFSALQRLQFALAKDGLFSTVLQGTEDDERRLIKPCQSSSSSNFSNGQEDANGREMHSSPSPNDMKVHISEISPNNSNSTNIFECPLCTIVCNSRHDFNEHLVTHSQQFACPKCSFFTDQEMKLKNHVVEAHNATDLDNLTDEETQTPKTNSQGKIKTFKCKQCGYQAVTKKEFWEHTKGHIRQEKMLTCPKCPFVTEYKHHLEYHLRNHFGSKPFQCTKCPYSCVNKSMLNSHLKSHSNIYQYRCADCAYATKYCHSLKLHLRKYDHKPSMVLNPDGTPNPLPIIDVYGTRRGPKIKRPENDSVDMGSTALSPVTPKDKTKLNQKTPRRQKTPNLLGDKPHICRTPPAVSPPQFPVREVKQEYGFSPSNIRMSPNQNPANESHMRANLLLQQFPTVGHPHQLNHPALNAGLHSLLLQNTANGSINPAAISFLMQNAANIPGLDLIGKSPMEIYVSVLNQCMIANNSALNFSAPMDLGKIAEERLRLSQLMLQSPISHSHSPPPEVSQLVERSPIPTDIPNDIHNALDLRNPKRTMDIPTSDSSHSSDTKKRKRKGKALRYDRNQHIDDNEVLDLRAQLDYSNNNYTLTNRNVDNSKSPKLEYASESENAACKYCDIAFPPEVYALHMKFHSSEVDPFRCNVCGTKSSDKVSFFVHIATASH